jgi:plasmid stabilization system protein ParE
MRIIWTPEASETLNSNLDYLISEWGAQVASEFLDRVDQVVDVIKSNPEIYHLLREMNKFAGVWWLNKSHFTLE